MKIYLPRTKQKEDAVTVLEREVLAGGTETILVAEDDDEVRANAAEMLTDLGYRVFKAGDATSALSIIEKGHAIDLLFTDVVMPGVFKSPELPAKRGDGCRISPCFFTSGYTENAIVHGGRLDAGVDLLPKPYTRDALARKIRQVLERSR